MTLFSYIQKGGIIMYILLFMNIIGFGIMFTKFIFILKELKNLTPAITVISQKIKDLKIKSLQNNELIFLEIIKREVAAYIEILENGVSTVKIIATIAPLLGLLGTVLGVLISFKVMSQNAMGNPAAFASGISLALITTIGGLIVAIPHYIGHNYILSLLDKLEAKLEKIIIQKLCEDS